MNIIDILRKQKVENLRSARDTFYKEMNHAIDVLNNRYWINDVITEDNEPGPGFHLREKAMGLVQMDRDQIKASNNWTLAKTSINAVHDTALQGQKHQASAWFNGEQTNRTFY